MTENVIEKWINTPNKSEMHRINNNNGSGRSHFDWSVRGCDASHWLKVKWFASAYGPMSVKFHSPLNHWNEKTTQKALFYVCVRSGVRSKIMTDSHKWTKTLEYIQKWSFCVKNEKKKQMNLKQNHCEQYVNNKRTTIITTTTTLMPMN